jgi:diacylglycerol kinase (ATP)
VNTCVIVNPRSGGVKDASAVISRIREHPALLDPEVRVTTGSDNAAELAREALRAGYRRILACGGDGTLHEVVNGVGAGRPDVVVGVLPMGTGNDFARSVGFPGGLAEALDLVASAVPRPIDLVQVTGAGTGRWLVNCSAGGFSGMVDEELTAEMKQTWGPLAYLGSALKVLPDLEGYETRVSFDGESEVRLNALNVVVANGRTAAGGIPVAPAAWLDDGLLDVMVVEMAALGELAAVAPRILMGTHLDHELVSFRRARRVSVASTPGMWFNVDGELVGKEPLVFEVRPGALHVLTHPTDAPAIGGG